jgi:hypothetical protein
VLPSEYVAAVKTEEIEYCHVVTMGVAETDAAIAAAPATTRLRKTRMSIS